MTHVFCLLRRIPPAVFCLVLLALLLLVGGQAETAAQSPAPVQHVAEAAYQKTADQCHRLLNTPSLGGKREDWLKEIQELERIYRQQPQGRTASAALHLHARMRQAMHQQFRQAADLDQAVALFSNVVSLFPKSSEAAESLFALAQIEQNRGNLRGAAKTYYKLAHGYPFSSRKRQAEEQLRQLTIIAESLAARKEGRKPAPLPTAQPAPTVKAVVPSVVSLPKPVVPQLAPKLENKPQEKLILSLPVEPSKPVFKPVVSIPPAITIQPTTIAAQPAPAPENKPQEKIVLPAAPAKPAPPAAEKKNEEPSLLSRLIHPDFSFSLFGSDEEKKEPVKPAASTVKPVPPAAPSLPAPAPEKIAAAPPVPPPKEPEPTAKIVVSELKIASLEQEKKAAPPAPKLEPKPLPPPVEVKPEPEKAPVIVAAPPPKEEKTEPPKPVLAELLPIQHWSSDNYNRVAVSTSRLAAYQAILPEKGGKQLRLEFKQSHVGPELRLPLTVNKGLIKSIQAEQKDEQTVQVSFELAEEAESKIFSLNDPFRVVVDLRKAAVAAPSDSPKELTEQEKEARTAAVKEQIKVKPKAAEKHNLTLAQQLGLGIKRIMIDPGHGGKDSGATGFGLEEKKIVLDVAKRVRELLKKENYEVLLTRETDIFIPLEERTAIANTKGADLFLSIHVNAHPSATVKGVETYYLNLAANPEAMRVAALENATSSRSMSEMEDILASLMKNSKINESSLFAEFVQTSMTDGLRRYKVKDLGVKKAPFYVLIGAQMPAALAEISFISNKEEAELLKSEQYLQAIAKRIAVGVVAYIEHRRSEVTAATQH